MPRKKCNRIVDFLPTVSGFDPVGKEKSGIDIELYFEEYEAIRLLDYEGLSQVDASEKMNVSRPTITRIYEEARRKVAKAFVEGRAISIKGGNYAFSKNWGKCGSCEEMYEIAREADFGRCRCKKKQII